MKTNLFKSSVLSVMILLNALSFGFASPVAPAEGDFKYVVLVYALKNKQQFAVTYSAVESTRLVLTIRNESGEVIYRDAIKAKEINKIYDLRQYGNGKYMVEVKANNFTERKTLEIKGAELLEPTIDTNENANMLSISYRNQSKEEVSVVIANNAGETVFSEASAEKEYKKRFDLEKLPAGDYQVILSNGNQTVRRVFQIKK